MLKAYRFSVEKIKVNIFQCHYKYGQVNPRMQQTSLIKMLNKLIMFAVHYVLLSCGKFCCTRSTRTLSFNLSSYIASHVKNQTAITFFYYIAAWVLVLRQV